MPEDDVRKMLGENAIRFLGLDRSKLSAVAEQVGFTIDEITGASAIDAQLLGHLEDRCGFAKPAEGASRIHEIEDLVRDDVVAIGATVMPDAGPDAESDAGVLGRHARGAATRATSGRTARAQYLDAYDEFVAQWGEPYNELFETRAFSDEYWAGRRRNGQTAGHYDPHAWMHDMDRDGVAGGIIFHDSLNGQPMPFDLMNTLGNGIPLPEARELAGVGRQMYNRWLADFCATTGGRGLGLAQLPFWDVDASIDELEWCADHGLGGVNFPSPGQPGMPPARAPRSRTLLRRLCRARHDVGDAHRRATAAGVRRPDG